MQIISKNILYFAIVALTWSVTVADALAADQFKSDKDKLSYAIGYNIGKNFKKDKVDFDQAWLSKGLQDGLTGSEPLIAEKELNARMTALQAEIRKLETQRHRVAAEDNRKAGQNYLAENAKKPGVIRLPSGLQYKVIKAGNGPKATDTDSVLCHYKGSLLNGQEFDSTGDKPTLLQVSNLIPGWKEALKLMPAGSKWQIAVPYDLAYGSRGAGQLIGPNETLLFELEVLEVKPANPLAPH